MVQQAKPPQRPPAACYGDERLAGARVLETIEAGVTRLELWEQGMGYHLAHCRKVGILTIRQIEAAEALERRYRAWRQPVRVTASYGQPSGAAADISDDEAEAQARAKRDFHHLLQIAPADTRHALSLLAGDEWPVMGNALGLLRKGLEAVADHLRLAK